ncbi:hypothetical protein IV203_023231 [Nitzschia inconspicua]|uniref:Uncharacterized protein n=1 Tax=Nitzschia inconspicua TaxID=303405 RepID=A0A9K3KDR8_9STRA|nr:hypothetical protein IV203_023231 [Nitzschia inconspicua]
MHKSTRPTRTTRICGTITDKDLADNRKKLSSPWNPDDDLDTFWGRVTKYMAFAKGTAEPIPEVTAMSCIPVHQRVEAQARSLKKL